MLIETQLSRMKQAAEEIHRMHTQNQMTVHLDDIILFFKSTAWYSAVASGILILFIIFPFTGPPGVFQDDRIRYVSDNLAEKEALGAILVGCTIPTWMILACSLHNAKEVFGLSKDTVHFILLNLMSLPVSTGFGLIFFTITRFEILHYIFTTIFVVSIGVVHLLVNYTAEHSDHQRWYLPVMYLGALSGVLFLVLAIIPNNISQSVSAVFEYICVVAFLLINSRAGQRVEDHMKT